MNIAHASPRPAVNIVHHKAEKSPSREDERRKRRTTKAPTEKKVRETPQKKSRLASIKKIRLKKRESERKTETSKPLHTESVAEKKSHPTRLSSLRERKLVAERSEENRIRLRRLAEERRRDERKLSYRERKHYGRKSRSELHRIASENDKPLHLSKKQLAEFHKVRATAMAKLMDQLGKPYLWGGTSPRTGFDCSGLVWYAYKDLVNYKLPRTANEMFHMRDAAPVSRDRLQRGDLVFFHIRGHRGADHVGVYLGGGKFIQSPRTGEDIHISELADSYWRRHYLGARRMMTPSTIR
nr:C40 family peptidase [Izhakiella australiensis]